MRTERAGSGAHAERRVRNEGVWSLMWLANIHRDATLNIPTRRGFVESLASLLRENNNLAGTGRKTVVVKPQLIVNERQVGQLTVIVGWWSLDQRAEAMSAQTQTRKQSHPHSNTNRQGKADTLVKSQNIHHFLMCTSFSLCFM